MHYFDDTFVTLFEANLSLELQMAFKNSDISLHFSTFQFLNNTLRYT